LATNWRPSISMRSPPLTDMPVWAISPLTFTRPSAMRCSSARREPRPACASTLCRRSSSLGASATLSSLRLSDSLRLPAVGCCLLMSAPGAVAVVGEGVLLFGRGIFAVGVVGCIGIVFVFVSLFAGVVGGCVGIGIHFRIGTGPGSGVFSGRCGVGLLRRGIVAVAVAGIGQVGIVGRRVCLIGVASGRSVRAGDPADGALAL